MSFFELLLNAHSCILQAASLPENTRPFSVQSRLDTLQDLIMKEIESRTAKQNDTPPRSHNNDDDIPF